MLRGSFIGRRVGRIDRGYGCEQTLVVLPLFVLNLRGDLDGGFSGRPRHLGLEVVRGRVFQTAIAPLLLLEKGQVLGLQVVHHFAVDVAVRLVALLLADPKQFLVDVHFLLHDLTDVDARSVFGFADFCVDSLTQECFVKVQGLIGR